MQGILRWLAELKGIVIEPGAEIRFELSSFPSGGAALLVILALVAILVLIGFLYRRDGRSLTLAQRFLLASLRCLAVIAALLIVFEPNLVAVKREVRPGHAIVLVDVSQSMGHTDAYRRDEVRDLLSGWREVGIEDPAGSDRMALAKALLAHGDHDLIRRLSTKNRVMLYGFAGGIETLPTRDAETADEAPIEATNALPAAPIPKLDAVQSDGRHSNIGGAVRAALERSREAAIAGVILLSDGRRNLGPQAPETARLLAQRKVPNTLVLGIGDPSATQTVEVTRIEVPEKVFQKDPFRVKATLASQGYDLMTANVRLVQLAEGADTGTQLAARTVQLGGEKDTDVTVEFDQLTAQTSGIFTYKVEITPPSGEPPSPERHSRQAQIEVLSEQTRVLLIAGSPTHEYRILRNELTRDKTIELACWLTSADEDFPQDGNRSLEALPADRAELDEWDVVVMMDADPGKLTREFCELVAAHVSDDGAGLWWVCGDKYSLAAMQPAASTAPLAQLLPIEPDLEKADYEIYGLAKLFPVAWPIELTPVGTTHKIARLLDDKDANALLWPQLPGAHFAFPVKRIKAAATAIARHGNPKLRVPSGSMPLIVTQYVGAGRVLFSGMDETYQWRSVFEEAYNRYWVKGIRFLFEGRLSAGNSRFGIRLSEEKLELGEMLHIVVEAKDAAYQPLVEKFVDLRLERDGVAATSLRLAPVEAVPGQYEVMLRPDTIGFYRLAPAVKTERDVAVGFQVVPAAIEKEGPMDLNHLATIAEAEGGELFRTPTDLLAAIDRIPSMSATNVFRTPHAIWDTWVTVMLILGLLALEWWLRKMFNLL